jgi:hypothetical protein
VPRSVVTTARFDRDAQAGLLSLLRGREALHGFYEVIARLPEHGMAVPGRPAYYSRPLHAGEESFLILYTFDETSVTLLAIRPVPQTAY